MAVSTSEEFWIQYRIVQLIQQYNYVSYHGIRISSFIKILIYKESVEIIKIKKLKFVEFSLNIWGLYG